MKFDRRAGRVSGPYGGIVRWGKMKDIGKMLRKTWAAVSQGNI